MGAPSRSLPLVALVLGVAILVVQIRVIAGGQTWDDVGYHTVVTTPRLAAAQAVQRGEAPGWWDGSGLGVPLAGEPSHGALYPPTWLAATPRALDLSIIAHLAWAALGIAVWGTPPHQRSGRAARGCPGGDHRDSDERGAAWCVAGARAPAVARGGGWLARPGAGPA